MKSDPARNRRCAEMQTFWSGLGVLHCLFVCLSVCTIVLLKSIFRHFPL